MKRSPFKTIDTIPYGISVLLLWSDGTIDQDFWYDCSLSEWKKRMRRSAQDYRESVAVPTHWMLEPVLPDTEFEERRKS